MRRQAALVAAMLLVAAAPLKLAAQPRPYEAGDDEVYDAAPSEFDVGPGDGYEDGPYFDGYEPRRHRRHAQPEGHGIIDHLLHHDQPDDCCDDSCCPPWFRHRTMLFGELIYLRPRDAEVAYAVPINGPVNPVLGNDIQIGPTAVVDPDYQSNFRVGFAYALDCWSSLAGTYWNYRSSTSDDASVTAPDVIRSLVTHPLGANAASDVLSASATLDIDFDIVDADYRGKLWCTDRYIVNLVVGARYATLTQDFHGEFSRNGVTTVDTNIDFDGGGIRLGLDGERALNRFGWMIYGRGTANFVGGEFRAHYNQSDAFQQTVVDTDWRSGRIVSILDLELGVAWVGPEGRFRASAGYLASAWFNAVKTDDFIKAVQANNFTGLSDTLTFDGLTARAEYRF